MSETADLSPNIQYKIGLLGEFPNEKVKFFEMETGSSIYEEQTRFPRKVKYLQMNTLDNIVQEYELKGTCFIKLDVQGSELDVLKGATSILKKTEFLLLEISTLNYNKDAPIFSEVIQFLDSLNFILFDICDERRNKQKVLFQVDLLFVNNKSPIRKQVNYSISPST